MGKEGSHQFLEQFHTISYFRIFLSYVLDLVTHLIPNSASWRVPVGLQLVWGLILLSGVFFLPESPYVLLNYLLNIFLYQVHLRRHLIGTGRREEARTVIAALNGVPEDDGLVNELVGELDFAIHAENEGGKATWLECFSTRNHLWKRTINGMMLQFIQQLNGQNFYCTVVLWGSLLNTHFLFLRLLWRYLFPKRRDTVSSISIRS